MEVEEDPRTPKFCLNPEGIAHLSENPRSPLIINNDHYPIILYLVSSGRDSILPGKYEF